VADLTVTMIDVHVTALLGIGAADVAVSRATAHSDFPQLVICGASPTQAVSGHAFIASEDTTPSIVPALVGYVSIPASGGTDSQQFVTLAMAPSGSPSVPQISAGAALSEVTGSITRGVSSKSDSLAKVAGVCILPIPGAHGPPSANTCTIFADLAKSVSYSSANVSGASSADNDAANGNFFGATEFQNLSIGGTPIALPVTRNMSLLPAGLPIEVILDEQTCDFGTVTSSGTCGGTGQTHNGLTVTAIHVILLGPLNGLPIGAEIMVSQAHSDATYRS